MGPEYKGSDNSIMLRHIREKFATHTVRVSRAKIMLVGSGAVGKTTLVHRLASGEFVQTQGHTDGVLMSTLQLGELGDIEAAVLDFG
jgi:GTPase SAR1 family protein